MKDQMLIDKYNELGKAHIETVNQLLKKDELIKERDAEIDNLVLTNKIIGNDKECFKLEIKRQKGEIERLKGLLEKAKIVMLSWCDRNECDADDIHEWFKQYEELKK